MNTVARRGSLVSGINWMGGLTLLLFWLPVAGPLIAGLVGGYKAGSLGRAIAAVFLPAIFIAVMVGGGIGYLTDLWLWGLLAGVGGLVLALLGIGPLLLGAVVGGTAAALRSR